MIKLGGMNPPKVDELDYIQFLVAAQRVFSTVEAAKIRSGEETAPAHDAYTRLLQRMPPDSQGLWHEVEPFVEKETGILVIDDSCAGYLSHPLRFLARN